MIRIQKKHVFALMLVTLTGISACHKNPAINLRPDKVALLLVRASRATEATLNIEPHNGWVYSNCMEDNKGDIDCPDFFKTMLLFVQKNDALKHMTYADLTNKDAFERISEDYNFKFFNGVD